MAKRNSLLLILLLVSILVYQNTYAQYHSEAPITIKDKKAYTNMLYVKFKESGVLNFTNNYDKKTGTDISEKHSGVKNIFTKYCINNGMTLEELTITKAIPSAKTNDTLFTDIKTNTIKKLPDLSRIHIIHFKKDVPIEDIIAELRISPDVEYVHGPVEYVNCSGSTPIRPNDTYFQNGSQWYLDTTRASYAWGITTGSNSIKVAVVDPDGVQLTHSDLSSKITGGDNNPAGIIGPHGTMVAGLIGANTNNNLVFLPSAGI